MKKVYLVATLSILSLFLNAQFKWAQQGGLWAYDYGYGIVTDNSGNVYVAGKFEFDAVFSGQFTVQCKGNHDSYLAKYDNLGNMQWIKTSGGPDGDYTWGLSTDNTNLFVAGEIEGSSNVVFSNASIILNGKGDNDVFLAKYDMNGNVVWAKSEGTINSEKALNVTNDASGNMYICGYFTDATNFNGTAIAGYGGRDIFIAKYDGNGVFQWVTKAGSSGRDEARSIKVDNNGNVYVCGVFSGTSTFGSITKSSSDNFQDSFLAKLNASDGAFQWVKRGDAVLDDVAWSLVFDNSNNLYVTGEFNSWITWEDNSKGVATTKNSDVYVAKFDNAGTVQWIRNAGGQQVDRARGMGTNGTNMFITGQFGGTANFGSTDALQAADSSDIFIAAIDGNGNWLWSASAGGPADTYEPLGYESGIAVTANNAGVYATGGMLKDTLQGNGMFADFGGIPLGGFSRTDMFVAAIGLNGVGVGENISFDSPLSVYPNPTSGYLEVNVRDIKGATEIKIFNMMGQQVLTFTNSSDLRIPIDMSGLQDGIYLVDIKSTDKAVQKKVIVQH